MTADVLTQLLWRFIFILDRFAADPETGSLLILKEMKAVGASWQDVLGPMENLAYVDMRAGSIITGPRLDAFTIPQLALRYLDRFSPHELALFALCKIGTLEGENPSGGPIDRLWQMHAEWRRSHGQMLEAARHSLNNGPPPAPAAAPRQRPGETQYEAIARAIGATAQPAGSEEHRRAAFVAAVMRPAL